MAANSAATKLVVVDGFTIGTNQKTARTPSYWDLGLLDGKTLGSSDTGEVKYDDDTFPSEFTTIEVTYFVYI